MKLNNQNLYDKAKRLITRDACMKFFDALKPLYLEMDVSGIGLRAVLLQMSEGMNCLYGEVPDNVTLHPIAFASKSIQSRVAVQQH